MQGGKAGEGGAAPPSHSQRVQLEVDILAGDLAAQLAQHARRTDDVRPFVLVVSPDEGLVRYIALCVGMRSDLELVIASSIEDAISSEPRLPPHVVIADAAHASVIHALARAPALLIVDDPAEVRDLTDAATSRRLAVLVRPFNARTLLDRIDELLE